MNRQTRSPKRSNTPLNLCSLAPTITKIRHTRYSLETKSHNSLWWWCYLTPSEGWGRDAEELYGDLTVGPRLKIKNGSSAKDGEPERFRCQDNQGVESDSAEVCPQALQEEFFHFILHRKEDKKRL